MKGDNTMEKASKMYKKEKINLLTREFCIPMSNEQKEHLKSLETEISVDNYALQLIFNHLDGVNA